MLLTGCSSVGHRDGASGGRDAVTAGAAAPGSIEAPPPGAAGAQSIFVVRRGWHVEVAFAAADLAPPLTAVLAKFPGARYLSIGFGDRHYLVAKHKNSPPSLLLALWPGPGLMLTTGLSATPQRAFGDSNVIELRLPPTGMQAAQAYVGDTITFDEGEPRIETERPYEGGLYLAATRRYSAANTCNTWVARTLQAAGFPVHSAGVALAGQIWSQVQRVARAQAAETAPRGAHPAAQE